MKMLRLLLVILSFNSIHFVNAQTIKRCLFIGNSYTYANNLPQLISTLAKQGGDSLYYESNTPGGYTFEQHASDATTLSKVAAGNWDFVVLQEQSQRPSFPNAQVALQVMPYAHMLDSLIRVYNPCGETMFFMTWGRKNGDAQNCASWPPVCTYQGMDSLLHLRYMTMADANNAVVAPVGALWKYIRQHAPTLELYQPDESHPSEAGSYAAACAFYAAMYRKDPALISYDYNLSSGDATFIRQAAKTMVFDSLSNWFIGTYDIPVAQFTYTQAGNNTVQFINQSQNAAFYFWDFGDGNFSLSENPIHTYASAGTYSVELQVENCLDADTAIHNVNVITTDLPEQVSAPVSLFPNPARDFVYIQTPQNITPRVSIYNSKGMLLLEADTQVISCSTLAPGLYFVYVQAGEMNFWQKLIICH